MQCWRTHNIANTLVREPLNKLPQPPFFAQFLKASMEQRQDGLSPKLRCQSLSDLVSHLPGRPRRWRVRLVWCNPILTARTASPATFRDIHAAPCAVSRNSVQLRDVLRYISFSVKDSAHQLETASRCRISLVPQGAHASAPQFLALVIVNQWTPNAMVAIRAQSISVVRGNLRFGHFRIRIDGWGSL